jgi:hypothetical protein
VGRDGLCGTGVLPFVKTYKVTGSGLQLTLILRFEENSVLFLVFGDGLLYVILI